MNLIVIPEIDSGQALNPDIHQDRLGFRIKKHYVRYNTPMIQQTYEIKASIQDVWEALTDPSIIQKWSGDIAVMSDIVGASFDLWSGQMWGTNTVVEVNKLLEQDWYGGDWDKPSKVTIELSELDGVTTVTLSQIDVPSAEEKNFENGWRDFYFIPMKELLES